MPKIEFRIDSCSSIKILVGFEKLPSQSSCVLSGWSSGERLGGLEFSFESPYVAWNSFKMPNSWIGRVLLICLWFWSLCDFDCSRVQKVPAHLSI